MRTSIWFARVGVIVEPHSQRTQYRPAWTNRSLKKSINSLFQKEMEAIDDLSGSKVI